MVKPTNDLKKLFLRGVFGTIWRLFEKKLNFTSSYKVANHSGILSDNNEWSGLMGMILHEGMDAGIGEVVMSPERCSVIRCLRPIIATRYDFYLSGILTNKIQNLPRRNQLYFKKTRLKFQWDAILKPFHTQTWVAIFFWFISSSACLNICFRFGRSNNLEDNSVDFNFFNSVTTVFSAFCQQGKLPDLGKQKRFKYQTFTGSNITPDSVSCRMIFFMSYIVAAVIFTVYSASMTSFLTLQHPFRPFGNLKQLLQDGTYSLQVVRNSAAYVDFAVCCGCIPRSMSPSTV